MAESFADPRIHIIGSMPTMKVVVLLKSWEILLLFDIELFLFRSSAVNHIKYVFPQKTKLVLNAWLMLFTLSEKIKIG